MASKIYTKTGDTGETGLFGGARVRKDHDRIEAYGTVDELNSHIGYLHELISDEDIKAQLRMAQNKLFNIGSALAVDPDKSIDMPSVSEEEITILENEIDKRSENLPELKSFILPSGHPQGAYAHIVRTVCRRAERRVVSLSDKAKVDPLIIRYLNRMSDYLFILARFLTIENGGTETLWQQD